MRTRRIVAITDECQYEAAAPSLAAAAMISCPPSCRNSPRRSAPSAVSPSIWMLPSADASPRERDALRACEGMEEHTAQTERGWRRCGSTLGDCKEAGDRTHEGDEGEGDADEREQQREHCDWEHTARCAAAFRPRR
jgi:hypothetical protein